MHNSPWFNECKWVGSWINGVWKKKVQLMPSPKKMSKECWILSPNYITKLNRNGTEIELKWIGIKAGD